jgi:enoyl-CoA hydratase/carnithine racemase
MERPGGCVAKLTLNNPPLNLVTLEMTERLIEAAFCGGSGDW